MEDQVLKAAQAARQAALRLAVLPLDARNHALLAMADAVARRRDDILAENQKDIDASDRLVAEGKITKAVAARLKLGGSKFDGVVEGLRSVAAQPDPLGQTPWAMEMDKGLEVRRVSCPIGVIGVIFESRPDALPQIASLCLKSGNALLLKGGSEALHSNRILARVLDEAARTVDGVPNGWMTLLETRQDIKDLLALDQYVDLIVPRGGNEFVQYIMDNTNILVMGHRDGICHTYVHAAADPPKAIRLTVDGKCQYPAVCNATETLLIDRAVAPTLLMPIATALAEKGVELRADPEAREIILRHARGKQNAAAGERVCPYQHLLRDATEEDWRTEYLDLIISIRVLAGLDEAIAHVNHYGSHHTDTIVTEDAAAAERFLREVDSASVLHNVSTRFSDGFRYGLGAEVGISNQKLHARGPVGLEGLTIYKYVVRGSGQIVADYSGPNARKFSHRPLPC